MKQFLFIYLITISLQCFSITSGIEGIGGGLAYNFQHMGVGADLRIELPIGSRITIVPQINYFSFISFYKQVNEVFIGANAHINMLKVRNVSAYGLAGGFYSRWINHVTFNNKYAQLNNVMLEVGGGVKMGIKCLAPYIEARYNTKWQDMTLHAGVIFNLKCNQHDKGKPMSIIACPNFKSF